MHTLLIICLVATAIASGLERIAPFVAAERLLAGQRMARGADAGNCACKGDAGTYQCKIKTGTYQCDCNMGARGRSHNATTPGICCQSPRIPCMDYSTCIDFTKICDGKPDCADCSDEKYAWCTTAWPKASQCGLPQR